MKIIKSIIPLAIMFILIFSTMNPVSADIVVSVSPTTANVGDTVTITVTVTNNDLVDWNTVIVSIPIPDGLEYKSFVIPNKTRQNYDPDTGIWDVNNMRHDERGLMKVIIITTEVSPEAAGKNITATARFTSLIRGRSGINIASTIAPARAHITTINSTNTTKDPPKPDTKDDDEPGIGDTGKGKGIGNGTGNGTNLYNLNIGDKGSNFMNLQAGGSSGKTYEITNSTNAPNNSTSQNTIYGLLATLGIVTLILLGYLKGVRE